jgi:protocatechuate 3,4-dioxygenase beta subunit
MNRSFALRVLGVSGGGAFLAYRGDAASSAACAVTPKGEIGPFFTDDSATGFNRSNIVANTDGTNIQAGIPLTLRLSIRDSRNGCAALSGSQVDIWHCNAAGVYSDVPAQNTSTQTWLRGYQLSDANGLVTFTTIVPGWYPGRATHVHLRVRSKYSQASSPRDGTNATQLFFPQPAVNAISTSVAPYSSKGTNPTTNASDRVYTSETSGQTLVSLTGNAGAGFTAVYTIGLPL